MVYLDMDQLLVLVLLLLLRGSATSQTTSSSTAGFSTPPHYHTTSSETQPESATSQTTSSSTAGFSTPPHYLTTSSETQPESESVRFVGGDNRCAGILELKHQGDWRPVDGFDWTTNTAAVMCKELDCGSAVSVRVKKEFLYRDVWWISSDCVQSGFVLMECATLRFSRDTLNLTCSDSVRLVNGTSLCSGRLEVRSTQSNQRWSSVCEAVFDQQDAEVVCRELGCRAPSVLQGVLYGEVEAPMWTKEFQCEGNESALLDCRSSGSDRNSCSTGRAVGLTCSGSQPTSPTPYIIRVVVLPLTLLLVNTAL